VSDAGLKRSRIGAWLDRLARLGQQEDLNFLLTNRIPRVATTRFMAKVAAVENPVAARASIALMRLFAKPNLAEASQARFSSLQECFIRELKPGSRNIDPDPAVMVSPCDAIVGSCGPISGIELIQAKGFPYTLMDLLADESLVETYRDGTYATLRLTAGMYHRFHAPDDCKVHQVTYISGDTWNTNPIALARVEKLFCKNERAVIRTTVDKHPITIVPVASILVASLRLHCVDVLLHLKHKGPNVIPCTASYKRGEQMGWFQLGSTIIVFAPKGFDLAEGIRTGETIRMGQALMRKPM